MRRQGRSAAVVIAIAALATSTSTSAGAAVATTRSTSGLNVAVVATNGSGCPTVGTIDARPGPDDSSFTVTYHALEAHNGPGSAPTDFRRNCLVGLNITPPAGLRYAITGAQWHGSAHLAAGANGVLRWSYYAAGLPSPLPPNRTFAGPLDGDWQGPEYTVPPEALANYFCTPNYLNVNAEVRVATGTSGPQATNALTVVPTEGEVSTTYRLVYRTCP